MVTPTAWWGRGRSTRVPEPKIRKESSTEVGRGTRSTSPTQSTGGRGWNLPSSTMPELPAPDHQQCLQHPIAPLTLPKIKEQTQEVPV